MKFKETIIVPEEKREVVDHICCDICGKETKSNAEWPNPTNDNICETTVNMRRGHRIYGKRKGNFQSENEKVPGCSPLS